MPTATRTHATTRTRAPQGPRAARTPRRAPSPVPTPSSFAARFDRASDATAHATGSALAFALAVGVVVAWLLCGPFVGFGNAIYQLAINTGTTIVTFLMMFLLQNTQNRQTRHDGEMRERTERIEREHGRALRALSAQLTSLHGEVISLRALLVAQHALATPRAAEEATTPPLYAQPSVSTTQEGTPALVPPPRAPRRKRSAPHATTPSPLHS